MADYYSELGPMLYLELVQLEVPSMYVVSLMKFKNARHDKKNSMHFYSRDGEYSPYIDLIRRKNGKFDVLGYGKRYIHRQVLIADLAENFVGIVAYIHSK